MSRWYKFFPRLEEIPKKNDNYNNVRNIIFNGDSNLYPEEIENFIENSVTAHSCKNIFRKFLVGKGIREYNDLMINNEDTFIDFIKKLGEDYTKHKGFFVHVSYDLVTENYLRDGIDLTRSKYVPIKYTHIPYFQVRKQNEDDEDFTSTYVKCNDWSNYGNNKRKEDSLQSDYFSFNTNQNAIESQIRDCKGTFKGQIFFFNESDKTYPNSRIHSVINDCDSEFRISVFKNKNLKNGFYGKTIIGMPSGEYERLHDDYMRGSLDESQLGFYLQLKKDNDNFENEIQKFLGAENNGGVFVFRSEFDGDDISKSIYVQQIPTQINDSLFKETGTTIKYNIRKAFNNIPNIFIEDENNNVFSSSGEAFVQAKEFYQEQMEEDILVFEKGLKRLFKDFDPINIDNLKLTPITQNLNIEDGIN